MTCHDDVTTSRNRKEKKYFFLGALSYALSRNVYLYRVSVSFIAAFGTIMSIFALQNSYNPLQNRWDKLKNTTPSHSRPPLPPKQCCRQVFFVNSWRLKDTFHKRNNLVYGGEGGMMLFMVKVRNMRNFMYFCHVSSYFAKDCSLFLTGWVVCWYVKSKSNVKKACHVLYMLLLISKSSLIDIT